MVNFVRDRKKFALLTLAQAPTSTNIEHRVALSTHTLNTENSKYYSSLKNYKLLQDCDAYEVMVIVINFLKR